MSDFSDYAYERRLGGSRVPPQHAFELCPRDRGSPMDQAYRLQHGGPVIVMARVHGGREVGAEPAEIVVREPQPLRVGGLVLEDLQLIRGVGAVQELRGD